LKETKMADLGKILSVSFRNLIWLIDVTLFIIFSILAPRSFFSITNLHYILYSSTFVGFGVLAQGIVLISGNFDLSLGQMVGFASVAGGSIIINLGISGILGGVVGIILVVGFGALLGAFNGLLVGKLRLNAFLATLATYMIFFWGSLMIRISVIYKLPDVLLAPGGSKIANIWAAIFVFFLIATLLHFIMNHTRLGSNIYAIGGNTASSIMCGISRDRVIFYTYTLAGLLVGLGALLWIGYLSCIPPDIGDGSIFDFFAGSILGGVSLTGGRGKVSGMIGGVIFLGMVSAGLTMLGLTPATIGEFTGVFVLVAIGLYAFRERFRERLERI
jgi:simple sugar transport system permease protein